MGRLRFRVPKRLRFCQALSVPTVLRAEGLRCVVHPNDHRPARIHGIGRGWVVVVNLSGPVLREVTGCTEAEARRVLRLVGTQGAVPMEGWRRWHGR